MKGYLNGTNLRGALTCKALVAKVRFAEQLDRFEHSVHDALYSRSCVEILEFMSKQARFCVCFNQAVGVV